ncbi:hypothetical protein B0H13DRAFT_1862808 [Mycena leptocephala]|nr:hypothetical protein B0H13DRAFT_1862808 [Mycena leptocephala]
MGAAFGPIYVWSVTGFGNLDNLNTIHQMGMIELTAMMIFERRSLAIRSTSISQYLWPKRSLDIDYGIPISKFRPYIRVWTWHINAGGSINNPTYSALGKVTDNLQASIALAADILIRLGLCWRLSQNRSGIQSTKKILNFLIMTAINRGVFTMVFAALNMILFLTQPQKLDFMIAILLSDKLCSLCETGMSLRQKAHPLYRREYTVQLHGRTPGEHISTPVYKSMGTAAQNTITVTTVNETHDDDHDKQVSDMISEEDASNCVF